MAKPMSHLVLNGATTIEELAFVVDPLRQRLIPEDMMLLNAEAGK